ncbi:hypothetical protein BJX99DRAFT_225486 [Aspergillus californicus]
MTHTRDPYPPSPMRNLEHGSIHGQLEGIFGKQPLVRSIPWDLDMSLIAKLQGDLTSLVYIYGVLCVINNELGMIKFFDMYRNKIGIINA